MENSSMEEMTIEQMFSEAATTTTTQASDGGALNSRHNFCSSLNKHNNSIFSLTLDEIQCKSGKNFVGMSMDEFLANIWNVEEFQEPQFMASAAAAANNNNSRPTLSRQPSFSIPIPLCGKTVDEIWSEIHKEDQQQQQHRQKFTNVQQNPWQTQQQALGEMTLEDFLVKAGVVQESSSSSSMKQSNGNGNGNSRSSMVDLGFGITGDKLGLSLSSYQQNAARNNMSGNCFSTYQMLNQSLGVGEPASDNTSIQKCQSLTDWVDHSNKRRIIDGPPEVVVQRRQRRMIKNRESAARSRARKQAYTVELEVELNQLKEENVKLKQIVVKFSLIFFLATLYMCIITLNSLDFHFIILITSNVQAESERNRKQEMMQRKQSEKRQKPTERLRTMRRIASMAW